MMNMSGCLRLGALGLRTGNSSGMQAMLCTASLGRQPSQKQSKAAEEARADIVSV